MGLIDTVEKYLSQIIADETHRYRSWDRCFQAFNSSEQTEIHSLELAFYLASWGMYRGSSGLLQKNHLVHNGAIKVIFSSSGRKLRCNEGMDLKRDDIQAVLNMKAQLAGYYGGINFSKGAGEERAISPTDTLLSKIMLGTLGCVPAYDRYFLRGLKEENLQHTIFDELSLSELFDFITRNEVQIERAQRLVFKKIQTYYPRMKILDMYFWQIGYEKEMNEKTLKEK